MGSKLLDQYGNTIKRLDSEEMGNEQREAYMEAIKSHMNSYQTYVQALFGLDTEPKFRSLDPFKNHAWVFTATMIRATNLSQAPFLIFRETDAEEQRMNALYRKNNNGYDRVPKRGKARRIAQRHLTKSANPARARGAKFKALEPDPTHPLNDLFLKPNPALSGAQLWSMTEIFMSLRGESPWLVTADNAEFLPPGELPTQIWNLDPDRLQEFVGDDGELLGYSYTTRSVDPRSGGTNGSDKKITLMPHEIIMHKYANPWNPYRGLSPIAPVASSIDVDILSKTHNRAILKNSGVPSGVLNYDGNMESNEYKSNRKKWNQLHAGAENSGRVAIMAGKWQWTSLGISPKDMDYLNSMKWNRDEIFAVMRVPKSTAGITDQLNFATQLGQDKNLWDKGLLPDIRLFEDTLEATLFFGQPDNIVGAFDLSNIEALRAGISEQIDQAKKLTAADLHMPPDMAYALVGLEGIAEYPGSDTALVGLGLIPVEEALILGAPEETPPPEDEEDEPTDEDEPEEEIDEEEDALTHPALRTSKTTKARGGRIWRNFLISQAAQERLTRRAWLKWVRDIERQQLELLEQNINLLKQGEREKARKIVVPLTDMNVALSASFTPTYETALTSTFDLFADENKIIPVFPVDDPQLVSSIQRRFKKLRATVPKTMTRQLEDAITEGLRNGETINEIRQRIAQVFKVQKGAAKTLTVARTESASVMNDLRENMFDLQGFSALEWVTASDESVRESHKFFGQQEPQAIGTNFIELPGYPGMAPGSILRFPGDPQGAPSETINCRCVKIGIE